jgi:hypothetical protein
MNRIPLMIAAIVFLALCGCAQTIREKPTNIRESGFLTPNEYAMLTPTSGDKLAAMRYINASAPWSIYNKIMVAPVTYWSDSNTKVPADVQQKLTNYLYAKLTQALQAKGFQIVNTPGPGTAVIKAAIMDADAATPGLRTVSVIVPQARILNMVGKELTGSYAFSGSIQSEGKVTDSQSGQLLAAWVDKRSGGMSVKNADVWKWGDAENVMNYWAQNFAQRAYELHTGGGTATGTSGS